MADRIPTVKPIDIPGVTNYYAGDDGEIYKMCVKVLPFKKSKTGRPKEVLNRVETGEYTMVMMKISTWRTNERAKVKYVHVKKIVFDDNKPKILYVQYPVQTLIAHAYHNYRGKGVIIFKDGNKNNTKPCNISVIIEKKKNQGSLAS